MIKPLLIIHFLLFSAICSSQTDSSQTGIASFYGKKFEGRKTANGETFNNAKMTAAHKTFPMGTIVKVTNLKNDKSITVTINDRLPKKSKRIIDLSQKGANELGFLKSGTAKVVIKIMPLDTLIINPR